MTYFEMLENDLNKFIVIQKRNHLLYRLKKNIKERLQMITNMSITQDRLATLTQRIKSSQILKVDSKNKSWNDRSSNFEFHSKSTEQRSRRNDMMLDWTDQTNNSIDENRNDEIAKLFLKKTDKQNNDFKDEKICYNCDKKEHITSKCFKFKQKNPQINVIKNFRQNIQIVVERTSSIHFITEIFDESKN